MKAKATRFQIQKGQTLGVVVRNEKGVSVERQTATVRGISADGVELVLSNGVVVELFLAQEDNSERS